MTIRYSLFLAILPWLFPALLHAEEELAELAASKRGAALKLSIELEPGSGGETIGYGWGAFISDDGLALVSLLMLNSDQTPSVLAADGTSLEFGTILGIFTEQSLALIKFDHRPEAWLRLAPEEPELGETIALVTLDEADLRNGAVPPLTGPVMAKRSEIVHSFRAPLFARSISLGSGVQREQSTWITNGCFAIDRQGELVGLFNGSYVEGDQSFTSLAPVATLADSISRLVMAGKAIPFPLPEPSNPFDPASAEADWALMIHAYQRGDRLAGHDLRQSLLERHPDSFALNVISVNPAFIDPENPLGALAEIPVPDANEPAERVAYLTARSTVLEVEKDYEGAMRDMEEAVALSPQDCPTVRFNLANLYLHLNRLDEAERLCREAYQSWPECIELIEQLERLAIKRSDFKEALTLAKRINEVRAIYKPR